MQHVYLNGEFLPSDRARVSVFDRGFIFGDGVYEVIPFLGGGWSRLPHHLSRLDASLAAIHLRNPHTAQEWNTIFTRLLGKNETEDQSIYLQITRGVAPRKRFWCATVSSPRARPATYLSSKAVAW